MAALRTLCLLVGVALVSCLQLGAVRAPARPALLRHSQCAMEVDEEQQQGMSTGAKKVINNMRSESGVEFAPWMKIDPEAIARAEKERKARLERAANANRELDQLNVDPQAAELGAGGGLRSKVLSEEEIELRWSTGDEEGNEGFIIQRRKGGTENFEEIASYSSFAPLRTKGAGGGDYVYLDDTVPTPGTWVYRIVDCDATGQRSAVCQKLVEVDSQDEMKATIFVGVVIFGLAVAFFAIGTFIDPIQTTSAGRGLGGF